MNRTTILAVSAIAAACLVIAGCGDDDNSPAPLPTATSVPTLPPTATPTTVPTASATQVPTATSVPSNTPLPTSSFTSTATHTPVNTPSPSSTPTRTFTATTTDTPTASATSTETQTSTSTQTPTLTPTTTLTPTITVTPTITATPTATNTLGPLGIRHFVLDSTTSTFQVKISGGLTIPIGTFRGQTNGQDAPAFLDIEAGQPDENGFTRVNIIAASDYFYVDAKSLAGFYFCLKPMVPVMSAGILGCNGGANVSFSLNEDHHLGQVGVNGFTAAQCAAMQGHVEVPYSACSAGIIDQACSMDSDCDTAPGAGDGACENFPSVCTAGKVGTPCQKNAECKMGSTAGQCGMPHGGVCNGPLVPEVGTEDSGAGELLIAPNPDPRVGTNGMPIEIGFETALPCGDEGPGMASPFALTTGHSSSLVSNANNMLGHTLPFDTQGENFDCYDWQSNNKGGLVISAPALDQRPIGDVATIFNFFSH